MELFVDRCPKTCENFRALCTGEHGASKRTKRPLSYRGSAFHAAVADLAASGLFFGSDGLRSPLHTMRDPGTPAYEGDADYDLASPTKASPSKSPSRRPSRPDVAASP